MALNLSLPIVCSGRANTRGAATLSPSRNNIHSAFTPQFSCALTHLCTTVHLLYTSLVAAHLEHVSCESQSTRLFLFCSRAFTSKTPSKEAESNFGPFYPHQDAQMAEAQSQILSLGEQLVALAGHNSLDDQPIEQRPRNPRLSVDGSESVSSSLPARRRPPVEGPPADGDEKLGERVLSLQCSGCAIP
jgi:hypothetical protein